MDFFIFQDILDLIEILVLHSTMFKINYFHQFLNHSRLKFILISHHSVSRFDYCIQQTTFSYRTILGQFSDALSHVLINNRFFERAFFGILKSIISEL